MIYSAKAKRKIVAALAEQYSGATLRIFSGEKPLSPELSVRSDEIASLLFPSKIEAAEKLVVTIEDNRTKGEGVPKWFRVTSRDGSTIADGSIGDGEDLQMPGYIPAGARVFVEDFTVEP
jgi:hypothetical protein